MITLVMPQLTDLVNKRSHMFIALFAPLPVYDVTDRDAAVEVARQF